MNPKKSLLLSFVASAALIATAAIAGPRPHAAGADTAAATATR